MALGRPRTIDREELQNNMIEWAAKDTSINLCGFCAEYSLDPDYVLKLSKIDEDFGRTYRMVKSVLGSRREHKLKEGELHNKAYDLNAATYDLFLKEERLDQLKYESALKKEEASSVTKMEILHVNATSDGTT